MSSINNHSTPSATSQENQLNLAMNFLKEIEATITDTFNPMSHACIYRVPKELRELNESVYTPRLVSIGPLHSNDDHLKTHMEEIKVSYVGFLLGKTKGEEDAENILCECLKEMTDLIPKAKQFYAEKVALDEKMLVTDGCFILEILRRFVPIENEPEEKSHAEKNDESSNGCLALEVLRRMSPINKKPEKKTDAEKNNESSNSAVPKEDQSRSSDPIWNIPLVLETVLLDLLLLENQLPFFVLEKLFDRTLARISNKHTLSDYVLACFRERLQIGDANNSYATTCRCPHPCVLTICKGNNRPDPGDSVLTIGEDNNRPDHILHLLYNYYLGDDQSASKKGPRKSSTCMPCCASKEGLKKWANHPSSSEKGSSKSSTCMPCCASKKDFNESSKDMPSASDLACKGVKFESCKNIFEVDFQILGRCCGARFRIPTLYVDDFTEPILRNLIALEQCCPRFKLRVTSYAELMDTLVNTEKDVEELVRVGLIHNSLGNNEEASRFFNKLCKGVILYTDDDLYSAPRSEAVRYSMLSSYNIVPTIWTHIRCSWRDYPWTFIAFCIAFVSFGIALANFIRSFPW